MNLEKGFHKLKIKIKLNEKKKNNSFLLLSFFFSKIFPKTSFKGSLGLALASKSFQNNFSIFSSMRCRIWSSLRSHLRYSVSLSTTGSILPLKNCLKLSASTAKGKRSERVSRLILLRRRERAWNFAMFLRTTVQCVYSPLVCTENVNNAIIGSVVFLME